MSLIYFYEYIDNNVLHVVQSDNNVLGTKILQYNSLEGHSVWENDCYRLSTQKNVLQYSWWRLSRPEVLVVLATVSVAILSPVIVATFERIAYKKVQFYL